MVCRPVGQLDEKSSYEKYSAPKGIEPAGRPKLPKLCVSGVTDFFLAKFVAVKEAYWLLMVMMVILHGVVALSTTIRVPLDSVCDRHW